MTKVLDDIITGRISRMINFVDKPEDLLEQLDNLRYFVLKKIQQEEEKEASLTSKLSKNVSLQVGSTS